MYSLLFQFLGLEQGEKIDQKNKQKLCSHGVSVLEV